MRASRDPSGEFVILDDNAAPTIIVPPSPQELDVIEGEMMDLPEMDMVDKRALFDFNWDAGGWSADDEATQTTPNAANVLDDPGKKRKR